MVINVYYKTIIIMKMRLLCFDKSKKIQEAVFIGNYIAKHTTYRFLLYIFNSKSLQ